MVNQELMRSVVARIEADIAKWGQDSWAYIDDEHVAELPTSTATDRIGEYPYIDAENAPCSTKFCLAGHTVLEAGDKIILYADDDDGEYWRDIVDCLTPEGRIVTIDHRAQQLLGITGRMADAIFDGEAGGRGIEAFKELITQVTGVTFDEEESNG